MNSTSIVKQAKLNAWAERIKAQVNSGLSVRDWCAANQITKDQFYYWRQKLKDSFVESNLPDIVPVNLPIDECCRTNCTNDTTTKQSSHETSSFKLSTQSITIEISNTLTTDSIISIIREVLHA